MQVNLTSTSETEPPVQNDWLSWMNAYSKNKQWRRLKGRELPNSGNISQINAGIV